MAAAKKQQTLRMVNPGACKTAARRSSGRVRGGIRTLQVAVDEQIGERAAEIAVKMVNLAVKGNVSSAKFLVSLALMAIEGAEEEKDQKQRSFALELAAEPEWQEPSSGSPAS